MTQPIPPTDVDPESLARLFHETYERLAPDFGYRTREASAKPWADVPEQNRALMVATCTAVVDALARAGRLRDATGDETRAEELERFREHSVTLNSVGWRMAVALGDVPEGADRVEGNPLEQVDRLIAELERLRAAPAPSPSTEETRVDD